ncbi:MAG: cob(I)yrinic acid a,c-diamide adenosyltransferase [Candidatus Lokiarchaeota archaeon]|nr:cob(I)yrinic acid a,c-diamide adenosyltransferase [Candidatus Lokiarchaeota archaeon]MBD3199016.1 cob(I)yrinic acid a,c-diamide adenosyltransferase [Candidatus Lokiarchaeota archaeon]
MEKSTLKKSSNHLNRGLIHYYFGDGKGKTTTLVGAIIRALGHGLKPILIQYLKLHSNRKNERNGYFMGEIHFLQYFIEVRQFGTGIFINDFKSKSDRDFELAEKGLKFAKKSINSGEYDIVALDEIVNAVSLNLIDIDELINLLKSKPKHVEVFLTGAMFYKKLMKLADYSIGYNCYRHPYEKGIDARKGIEF